MEQSKIDKVVALLNKAERTDVEAEAEAFFAKAAELMERYGLEDAVLARARQVQSIGQSAEKPVWARGEAAGTYADTMRNLVSSIARHSHVKLIVTGRATCREYWELCGFKSDIDKVNLLYASLLIQSQRGLRNAVKAVPYWKSLSASEKYRWKRSYLDGFAQGVASRMQEANRLAAKQAEEDLVASGAGETGCVALAIRDKKAAVDDSVGEKYGKLVKLRSGNRMGSGSAQSAGFNAGRAADLGGKSVGGGRKELGK